MDSYNSHNDYRPWYWKTLDKCSNCYSYAVLQKINVLNNDNPSFSFKCNNGCSSTEYVQNIGVAICEWNKLQRKIKKDSKL